MGLSRHLGGPNLWDSQTDTRYNDSHKGLDGIRFYKGALGDNVAEAGHFQEAGRLATNSALGMYGRQATGQTPSLANMQMQQGIEQGNRGAMGMLGQSRGGNIAGSYGQALQAQQGAAQMGAQQGAMNRMMEQQAAMQGYSQLAQQQSQMGLGYSGLASQHQLAADQNDLGWYGAKRGMDLQQDAADSAFLGGILNSTIGMVGSAAGAVGAASDVRAKHDVRPTSVASRAAEVQGFDYGYNDGLGLPDGPQSGVMAQQLAQTSLGPTLVHKGPDGMLRVDGGRAGIVGLAASGENTRRIEELEKMLQAGGDATRYGSASDGAGREREASRLSNSIGAARGVAQTERSRGGPGYNFGNMPSMERGPRTIDPFAPSAPSIAASRAQYFPELGGGR